MNEASPSQEQTSTEAARILVDSGPILSGGLAIAGIAWGASHTLRRLAESPASGFIVASTILEGLSIAIGVGLVAWSASVSCRVAGALIAARAERRHRSDEALAALASRAMAAFERLADVLERGTVQSNVPAPPDSDRTRRFVEIDQALRSGRWGDAAGLIDELALRFPDDPALLDLRERLDAARRQEFEGNLAQIRAARQVNDHARVLELYRGLEPSQDFDRSALERELSRWFLELIHRRLRGGRIQPDVVELAATVAETFAATIEGASLRASLPTLRRSVGLCPRCARPYVGTAEACPQCLAGVTVATEAGAPAPEPELDPEPEIEDGPERPATSANSRDSDWMFYDEDDEDDPSPPT